MVDIAICDDDVQELEAVHALVCGYRDRRPEWDMDIRRFASAYDLAECLEARGGFDIYLLDIIMPYQDGIALGQTIRARDSAAAILYLTASADYAVQSYRVRAQDYLIKPIQEAELTRALDDALAQRASGAAARMPLRTASGTAVVLFNQLLYAEYQAHQLRAYLADGRMLSSRTLRAPFDEAARPLLEDGRFVKTSSAYIINMDYVRAVTARGFVMANGQEVPVTRRYALAKQAYIDYLLGRGRMP